MAPPPIDPCGHIMDMGRACYVSTMQFDEAGTINRGVKWYFCEPTATPFPTPHLFGSSNWQDPRRQGVGLGEQWDSLFTFQSGVVPFYAPGNGAFCGNVDWYSTGVPSSAPPLTLRPDGSPTCCPPNPLPDCIPFFPSNTTAVVKELTSATDWTVIGPGTGHEIDALPPGPLTNFVFWNGSGFPCIPGDTSTTGLWFYDTVNFVPLIFIAYDPATLTSTWTPDPTSGPPALPVWTLKQFP